MRAVLLAGVFGLATTAYGRDGRKELAADLAHPACVAVDAKGKVYVSLQGEPGKDGDGSVVTVENGKTTPLADGLDDPTGLAVTPQGLVYVADKSRVWRVGKGRAEVFAPANAFPATPKSLSDLTIDPESGTLYVTDNGGDDDSAPAVYRITPQGVVSLVTDVKRMPGFRSPNAIQMDGASHLLVADDGTGLVHRVKIATGAGEVAVEGLTTPTGMAWDRYGRLFIADFGSKEIVCVTKPGAKPAKVAAGIQATDLRYDPTTQLLLAVDSSGKLVTIPAAVVDQPLDESPTGLHTEVAFPNLTWAGWSPETDDGRKAAPFRPIALTHAGDGSNRVFVATQQGVIHVFPNDPAAKTTSKVFLDLRAKVKYDDRTNEEGFLGLAFHPRYKELGEFYAFYTLKSEKMVNVVARFKVSKTDPDVADPASEEEVFRFTKPFWNHDGGTVCFGPDGMLYVTHGDGGAGNDPLDNGQNLKSPLGKILRLDIDKRAGGKKYAVPGDNPFVGKADALPEVWAYGLRNVWRMSFDRETGALWAADVGQNLYEEINVVVKGGNYGWNRREGLHPFGARGTGPRGGLIDPIFEYNHDVGKSITGGLVYRGQKFPELAGCYLYGDYVSTKLWALTYDAKAGRVVANRPIQDRAKPIMSFGEDEKGEVYVLFSAADGKGMYTLSK